MLTRAPVSDETLLGYSIFLAMAAAALFILVGLGSFAHNEGAAHPAEKAETRPAPGKKKSVARRATRRPPVPTSLTLSADGSLVVSTTPLEARPWPRDQVGLVFAEMLLRKVPPPLIVRCNPGVTQGALMEILAKAREVGVQDIRLVVAQEAEGARRAAALEKR